MTRMTKLAKVQKAIDIRGYITVSVGGRDMQAHAVTSVDGDWITDIPTTDLRGYVRIRKTKAAIVAQADYILAHESEIRAEREAKAARTARAVMLS